MYSIHSVGFHILLASSFVHFLCTDSVVTLHHDWLGSDQCVSLGYTLCQQLLWRQIGVSLPLLIPLLPSLLWCMYHCRTLHSCFVCTLHCNMCAFWEAAYFQVPCSSDVSSEKKLSTDNYHHLFYWSGPNRVKNWIFSLHFSVYLSTLTTFRLWMEAARRKHIAFFKGIIEFNLHTSEISERSHGCNIRIMIKISAPHADYITGEM